MTDLGDVPLQDLYDGDAPKVELPRALAEAIHRRTDELRPLSVNAYRCKTCSTTVKTREVHIGVTYAQIPCSCGDVLVSAGHPMPVPGWLEAMPVRFEWYRPSADELPEWDPETQDRVLNKGGLVLREVGA